MGATHKTQGESHTNKSTVGAEGWNRVNSLDQKLGRCRIPYIHPEKILYRLASREELRQASMKILSSQPPLVFYQI